MAFKIEDGLVRTPRTIYPWPEMNVGQSVHIDTDNRHKVRSAASRYGRRNGKLFTCQRTEGGLRVFRDA